MLIVHVGCGDGQLTAALRVNHRFIVHGLDTDAQQITRDRDVLAAQGLSGPVSVEQWNGKRLPYVDAMVNLLVVDRLLAVDRDELTRVLTPGGVAVSINSQLSTLDSFRKPWPTAIDEWSHWLHAPDNNAV